MKPDILMILLAAAMLGAQLPLDVSPLPTGTERIAQEAEISLEIVGADHPELPNLQDGSKNHGGFEINFKDGRINFARVSRGGELLTPILVFHRGWNDEAPLDARAVGCKANTYLALDDPVTCFRAIVRKMEGGVGPVLLQVRYFALGQRAATIPINSVQIPWSFVKHYAKTEPSKKTN